MKPSNYFGEGSKPTDVIIQIFHTDKGKMVALNFAKDGYMVTMIEGKETTTKISHSEAFSKCIFTLKPSVLDTHEKQHKHPINKINNLFIFIIFKFIFQSGNHGCKQRIIHRPSTIFHRFLDQFQSSLTHFCISLTNQHSIQL